MDWLLQHKAWLLTILGIALILTVLPGFSKFAAFAARKLQRLPRTSPAPPSPANLQSLPSGDMGSTGDAPELAAQAPPSGYQETPTPSSIVAEVCSLSSPVRERVEQSYRGARVRWTLRLAAISEEAGSVHTVRMCPPNAHSALTCGVYFNVSADEYALLHAAQKDEVFVVEGTIETVEGGDIDLKDVGMIEKAA